jgi:methionyl-tRNA formyltransferase
MKTYNTVLFASPDFTLPILKHLEQLPYIKLVSLVTSPNNHQHNSPLLSYAQKIKLPVFRPHKLTDDDLKHLKVFEPDLFITAAYGQIIPQSFLSTPPKGALNIHFSLLPKYRGALCVQQALKDNQTTTGISLMLMDEQMDHGPILAQDKLNITNSDTTATLRERLTQLSTTTLDNNLINYLQGQLKPKPQDHSQATYTPSHTTNTKDNAYISIQDLLSHLNKNNQQALSIHRHIMANNPDPIAWTKFQHHSKTIKLNLLTSTYEKGLKINQVQLPGKQPTSWQSLSNGYPQLRAYDEGAKKNADI